MPIASGSGHWHSIELCAITCEPVFATRITSGRGAFCDEMEPVLSTLFSTCTRPPTWRKLIAGSLDGGTLAATISARERNHSCAINRNHAPATKFPAILLSASFRLRHKVAQRNNFLDFLPADRTALAMQPNLGARYTLANKLNWVVGHTFNAFTELGRAVDRDEAMCASSTSKSRRYATP
jgi:hypothetical protein